MKEQNKTLNNILVPSSFILMMIISTILITYSNYLKINHYLPGIIILLTGLLLLPLIIKKNIVKKRSTIVALIMITTALSFAAVHRIASIIYQPETGKINLINEDDTKKYYTGIIKNIKQKRYNRELLIEFSVKEGDMATPENKKTGLIIAHINEKMEMRKGDTVVFNSKIKTVNEPLENKSQYHLQLLRKGTGYTTYLNKDNFTVTNKSNKSIRGGIRESLNKKIETTFLPETGSLLKALYFGNKNFISKITINNFKRAGVLHVLAASGLHVGIIASIPVFLLGLLRINKKIILIITFVVILIYLLLTDIPVSLLRASLMFGIYTIQYIFTMDRNIFNTLFLTAIVILLLYPFELFSMGFQLSFGATLGILLFFRVYKKSMPPLPKIITNSISITISAQIIVIPIIILHMNELNLTGILSNLIIIPLVGLLLILSFTANLLSMVVIKGGDFFSFLTDSVYKAITYSVNILSNLNGHFFIEGFGAVIIASLILLLVPLYPGIKKKYFKTVSIFAAFLICWTYMYMTDKSLNNKVTMFSHNKGNTIIYNQKKHASIIGYLPGINGTKKIISHIKSLNINKLDIYITKPDFTNITSYSYLIKKMPVKRCIISYEFTLNKLMNRFIDILKTDNISLNIFDYKNYKYISGNKIKKNKSFHMKDKKVIALYNKYIKPSKIEKNLNSSNNMIIKKLTIRTSI